MDEWQADYERATELLSQHESYRGTLHTAEAIYNYLEFAYMGELTRLEGKLYLYANLGNSLNPTDSVYKNQLSQLDALFAKEKELGAFADPEIFELPLETRKEIFSDPIFAGMEYALKDYTDPEMEPFSEETNRIYLTRPIPLINTFASLLEENAAQAYLDYINSGLE